MTTPVLASPGRLSIAAIPVLGFLATPLLPFVNGPYLWFGVPSVLVWTAICVLATVVCLRIVEISYQRAGGLELDAAEEAADATPAVAITDRPSSARRQGETR